MSGKRTDKKGRILRGGETQRKDGKYEYKYTDSSGERRSVYSWKLVPTDRMPPNKTSDISLREKEEEIEKYLREHTSISGAQITLANAVQKYLEIRKFAPSTYENYKYYFKKDIADSPLGRTKAINLVKSDIKAFYNKLSREGYEDGTIQIVHKIIHPALEMLVDDNILGRNPADGCCRDYSSSEPREAMTPEERDIFYNEIIKMFRDAEKYYLIFTVMQGLSCRVSELVGLTWSDVNMKRREVVIDHGLLYRKKNGKTQFYITKGTDKNKKRIIPMTDEVYRAFQKLRERSLKNPSKREVDGYSNFVFVNQRGGPMYPTNINKALYRIVDRYKEKTGKDFPTISNHIFRHTGCTVMAEAEVDPSTMKYIMGHKNVKMILKVYDSVNPERIRQQMKKLNKKPMEAEKQRAAI